MPKTRYFHAHETARVDSLNGLPLAGFRQRAWAFVIDLTIVYVITAVLMFPFHHHSKKVETHEAVSMLSLVVEMAHKLEELAESALYFAIALKLGKGQTIGKRIMKLRVISLTHHEIGWWQAIERALGYGASFLEGGFGFVQFWINRNRMCVHDRIAETIVVDVRDGAKRLELAAADESGIA
ncbi:Uncharacterized membrane protein YckC, RDD family [Granulicella rosea]|uniref:Uncharacterized membrane protein YckC, RDD family n=1 Tax=Granulicella rosea TaxID=474952 RepID=A0A239E1Y1_9BACT|nr:RDD family protein [Granulicella rosea]SNS38509.1 Uncharacterized membrane protein YckC, RDD family [Granulicella rosea]